jgi:STE24 endopeptidase
MGSDRGRRFQEPPKGRPIALDPSLAADLWLRQIPPAARALADATTTAAEWRRGVGFLADGALLLALLKSRVLIHAGRWMAGRGLRPALLALCTTLLFAVLWEGGRRMVGLALAAVWPLGAGAPASGFFSAVAFDVLVLSVVVWTARASPKRWWIWLGGAATALAAAAILVAPAVLIPYARGDRPAASGAGAPILAFARGGGLDAPALSVFAGADPAAVDAEALGPIRVLAVSRAALAAPTPETYAALGHLLGHHRHGDLLWMTLLAAAIIMLTLFAAARGGAALASALGERGLGRASDPASAPALALVVWAAVGLSTPAFNLFDQAINDRADAYALSLTHDRDALARWLIREEGRVKADPGALETLLFYDHPPLRPRLAAAMRWTAAPGL